MSTGLLSLLCQCLLGVAAMGGLCMSVERHAQRVGLRFDRPEPRILLRWAGWAVAGLMSVIAIETQGWGHGLVFLLEALSLSAVLTVGLLTYRPRWLVHVTLLGLLGGLPIIVLL